MTKTNTHALLGDYRGRDDYPAIAKSAAGWAKTDMTPQEILEQIAYDFGAEPARLTLRDAPAPLAIFGDVGTHIPANAVEQMGHVMRLPVTLRGAMMPDAHQGYAMPIGGVAVLDRAVSPSFVGYDISCMMQLSILEVDPEAFLGNRHHFAQVLRDVTAFGIGAAFSDGAAREHGVMDDPLWDTLPILAKHKDKARAQLGSSGGGNHFCNLMLVGFLEDALGHRAGAQAVALMSHSGSRGTGHSVATHYVKLAEREVKSVARGIPKGYEWLSTESEAGQEYLAAMHVMGCYAKANHDLIHQHFAWEAGIALRETVWNRHNYAWVDDATGEVIHRKGATPADAGVLGIIPGTSGTASYLVEGLGNAQSINSSSHGAGRYHSRTQAKAQHDEAAFMQHMEAQDILHFGLASDETFQAYKDIEMVIGLQRGVLVKPLAKMLPKVVLMGGAEKGDDGD
jgi:tRNA-splicing ligase RtcB